ncbi:MAG: hypothetical protein ABJD11_13820 [Gemmatimonadota bacterium]
MAVCAFCNTRIVFGGRRVGEQVFCNAHCLLNGRAQMVVTDQASVVDLREAVRELRDALLVLAEEVEQQQTTIGETAERLDFAERALAQIRNATLPEPPAS